MGKGRQGVALVSGACPESVLNPGKEGHLLTLDTHSGPLKEGQRIIQVFLLGLGSSRVYIYSKAGRNIPLVE